MLLAAPPSVELRALTENDWTAVADIYWDGMRDGLATFETEVPTLGGLGCRASPGPSSRGGMARRGRRLGGAVAGVAAAAATQASPRTRSTSRARRAAAVSGGRCSKS